MKFQSWTKFSNSKYCCVIFRNRKKSSQFVRNKKISDTQRNAKRERAKKSTKTADKEKRDNLINVSRINIQEGAKYS